MPLKKLSDDPGFTPAAKPACLAPGHYPPLMGIQQGTWEWTCPACGNALLFSVIDAPPILVSAGGAQ